MLASYFVALAVTLAARSFTFAFAITNVMSIFFYLLFICCYSFFGGIHLRFKGRSCSVLVHLGELGKLNCHEIFEFRSRICLKYYSICLLFFEHSPTELSLFWGKNNGENIKAGPSCSSFR